MKLKGSRASPYALRALLSDPDLNTPHVGNDRPIGVMPDLKRIHRELSPWKFGSWLEWLREILRLKKA